MTLKDKKTCVVTGATGFIGRHLIKKLHPEYKIIGIGRRNTSPSNLIEKWIQFDFAKDNIEKIFISDKIDVFFHLAANTNDNKTLWEFEDRYLGDIVNPILLINYLMDQFVMTALEGLLNEFWIYKKMATCGRARLSSRSS